MTSTRFFFNVDEIIMAIIEKGSEGNDPFRMII
jgi:hypothetical protein